MQRLRTLATTTAILTTTALTPAVAGTADVELRGAPTLRQATANTATLTFAVDRELPRKGGGGIAATVRFQGGVSSIASWGRHGRDHRYRSTVRSGSELTAGAKYRVRIVIPGQSAIVRTVKLHAARG